MTYLKNKQILHDYNRARDDRWPIWWIVPGGIALWIVALLVAVVVF